MAELNVKLKAEIKDLEKKLERAQKDLIKTGEVAENSAKKIANTGKTAAGGMRTLTKSTANATPAMLEFSRVIQDAPFGIQGVANNIQQLTANFGNLSKQAGGTRSALKLMLGTLSGPAGILLAVSAVTALMVAFGDKLKGAGDDVKDLNEQLEELNKNFELEIQGSKLLEKNARLQNKEYSQILTNRIKILNNQLLSVQALIEERKQLLKINRESQKTIDNFDAISQSAVVTAGALIATATKDLGSVFGEQLDFIKEIGKGLKDVLGIEIDTSKLVTATKKEKETEKEITKELRRLENERLTIENQRLGILKNINKEQLKAQQAQTGRVDLANIFGSTDLQSQITAQANNIRKGLGDIFNKPLADSIKKVKPQLSNLETLFLDFSERMGEIGRTNLADGLSSVGAAIGTALAQGGNVFATLGRSILASFGQFLSDFGKQLVQYGVAALAFSNISKALLNPLTAGPAAAAAIAIGVALSAAGAALSSVSSGGLGGSGGVAGQGGSFDTGFTSTRGVQNFGGDSSVVFEISGTNLIGVLNKASSKNLRLGNG